MRTVSKDIMMICKGWYINHDGISKRQAVENYIKDYLDVKDYPYINAITHVYATKEEALEKAQELENEGKKKAEEKIFGEKRWQNKNKMKK